MRTSHFDRRRQLLQTGFGAASLLAAAGVAAGEAAPAKAVITPKQTEGPFFPNRPQTDTDIDMTLIEGHAQHAEGSVVELGGQIVDAEGQPVADALVDVWQANAHGRYDHERDPNPAPLDPHFQGWARFTTDAEGRYRLRTIRPGAYPVNAEWSRPPHLHFKVAKRGFVELTTQMYFAGEALNDVDRILQALTAEQRAGVVVAFAANEADPAPPRGQFTIVLQRV